MKLTYYGHSCFMLEVSGKQILFDPFISPNELAEGIDIGALYPDYILVSHGHGDHVHDVEAIARQSGAKLVSNFEIVSWFEDKGISNNLPMNHGGCADFDFGRVRYVNAIHSSTMPDGSSGGNAGGFIIETNEGNLYYAGDTALTMDMQLFARHDLKWAILPIGDNYTMGIDDAITATNFLKCNKVIAMHYDTFDLIKVDLAEARRKFRNSEKELIILEIGETREL